MKLKATQAAKAWRVTAMLRFSANARVATATWSVVGRKAKPFNALARRIGAGCPSQPQPPPPPPPQPPPAEPTFVVGPGVPADQEELVRRGLSLAGQFFRSQLGKDVSALTVFLYADLEGIAAKYAEFFRTPIETARQAWQTSTAISGPKGIFIYVGSRGWSAASNARRVEIVVHEDFHVLQNELAGPTGIIGPRADNEVPVGGPRWLIEGSAVVVAGRVLSAAGGDLASYAGAQRNALVSGARATTVPLRSLEAWTGMAAAGPDFGYSLAFVGADFLTASRQLSSLVAFWAGIGRGASWQEAFSTAFGQGVDVFYDAFETYRRGL